MQKEITTTAMQNALDTAPIGIVMLDSNHQIKWHNSTVKSLLGVSEEQLSFDDSEALNQELRNILIEPPETIFLQEGDQQRCLLCQSHSLADGGTVRFYIDTSAEQQLRLERDQLEEDLQQLTTRDPVTGLPNRRALLEGLEPLISRSRRYENPVSIIKLHIDALGAAEEQQHDIWIKVGQLLKEQMRWADIIGRFDGPDFLLILPETPLDASEALAIKLSEQLQTLALENPIKTYCGVTNWQKGDDATLMLQRVSDNVIAAIDTDTPVNSGN